jgi:xylulose-5-phosphate/fructose-6-phosphate phosphoketolase
VPQFFNQLYNKHITINCPSEIEIDRKMPSEFHETPNPPPEKSQLPDSLLQLAINLDEAKKSVLTDEEIEACKAYRRAANYIAAAMIFLKENALLERPVKHEDIKPRLLGHWGTCIPTTTINH